MQGMFWVPPIFKEETLNPFEGEVCAKGHRRTLQNTRMYNGWNYCVMLACLVCREFTTDRRNGTGIGRGTYQTTRTQYLWEDIEFMLPDRPTFAILEATPYSSWENLLRGSRAHAPHLTERLRGKRGNE